MARPRKTAAFKSLAGTIRQDRLKPEDLDPRESSEVSSGRPRQPKHLCPAAVIVWKETVRLMKRRKILTADCAPTLAVFCEVSATWETAKADVLKRGQLIEETRFSKSGDEYTVTIINPSVAIQRDSERQLLALTKSLGLAPDSREKVRRTRPTKETTEKSALLTAFPFLVEKKSSDEEAEDDDAG